MSLENRYLKYSEEITEDVYNEVIEVLEENGLVEDTISIIRCSYTAFKKHRLIGLYTDRTYIINIATHWSKKQITVAEILQHKKQKVNVDVLKQLEQWKIDREVDENNEHHEFRLGYVKAMCHAINLVKKERVSPINSLFKRHYDAIVKRGLIKGSTNITEFFDKLWDELNELQESNTTDAFNQEAMDCICVLVNMLIHEGVDIKKELIKNIEHNETRED